MGSVFPLLSISWRVHVHLSVVLPVLIILTTTLINFTLANPERSGSTRSKLSVIHDAEDEDDFHGQDHNHGIIVSPISIAGSSFGNFHNSDRLGLMDTISVLDHHHLHGTLHGQGVCEPIKIGLCMELGYNETTMPNLVGHDAQVDADALLQTFTPLIQYGCSPHLKLFLCSSHAPMCTDKTPQPIGPCRSLCESVRRKCEPVLIEFGFKWPPPLDCSKFYPENNHQHMCIPGPMDATRGGGLGFRSPSTNNWDNGAFFPTVLNNGNTQSTMNSKVVRNPMKDSTKLISSRPIPVEPSFDTGQTHLSPILIGTDNARNDITEVIDSAIGHGQKFCTGQKKIWSKGTCWTKCPSITNGDEERVSSFFKISEIKFVRNYTLSWGILTLLTSIVGLTLALRSPNLSTAERPVMYIALCQIMFSIGTIVGTSLSVSCFMDKMSGIELLAGHGIVPSPCALIFLLTYFFGMATNLWWVILCLSWMLSVNGSLWISLPRKERSLFHLVTWGTSSVLTSTALIYKKVDADEVTGLCGVGFQDAEALRIYVMIPLVGVFALGLCSLLTGLISKSCPNWIPAICCSHSNKSLHSSSAGQSSTSPHDSGARHNHAYSPVLVLPPPPFNLGSHHHHHHHNCSDQDDCSPSFFTNNPVSSNGRQLQRRTVEDGKVVWRRVAIFSVIHAFPVACQVGTVAYELVNRVSWDNGHGRPNLQILLLRLNMSLIPGLTAGVWVLSTFSWKSLFSLSQKLCCCHSLFNVFNKKNRELKVVPTTPLGVSDRTPCANSISPLIIPVPVNSLATSYVTLNGTTGVPQGTNQGHTHSHGRHFAGITPRYHQPALPPLPARNVEPCQLDGWRRTETIV